MAAEETEAANCQEDVPHKLLDHSPQRRRIVPESPGHTYHDCDTLHAECSLQTPYTLPASQRPAEEPTPGSHEEGSEPQEGGVDRDRLESRQNQHPRDLSWNDNRARHV